MDERIRPSNLGEILDRTAQFYRSRFLVFLGISVIPGVTVLAPALALFLLLVWLGSNSSAPEPSLQFKILEATVLAAMGLAVALAFLAGTALATAAMNHAVSRAYLGEAATIRGAYKGIWRRGWRYLWLYVLEALIVWVAPIAAGLAFLLPYDAWSGNHAMSPSDSAAFGFGVFLVFLAVALYGLWMLLRVSLAFPACVIERIGAWAAFKRSFALTQGTKGRIFLLYLLGVALTWLLTLGITVPMSVVMALLPAARSPEHAETAGVVILLIVYGAPLVVQMIVKPVYGIALTLFYYDQRIRQEGFDIEWMMLRAGLVAGSEAPAPPEPETAPHLPPMAQSSVPEPPQAETTEQSPQPLSPTPGVSQ